MKLIKKYEAARFGGHDVPEYFCEITDQLDVFAGLNAKGNNSCIRHYVIYDESCIKEKCLAIRIPGGTVGGIWIDEHNVITKINIDTKYVIKTYVDDVNEKMQVFIGRKIKLT